MVAVLLRDLKVVDGELRTVQDNAGEYRRLTDKQEEILQELAKSESQLSELNTRLAKVDRLIQGWDDWVKLEDCEIKLREIPQFKSFPENPVERLETILGQVRLAGEDRDAAAGALRRTSQAAEVDIPGEHLLDDAESIESIRRARSSFDSSVRDLPERQAELRALGVRIIRSLAHTRSELGRVPSFRLRYLNRLSTGS